MAANHKRLLKEVNNNPNFEFLENGKVNKPTFHKIIHFRFIAQLQSTTYCRL